MKLLDLFSGTGSVGTVAKELGFEVVSLDRDMAADIKCDILDWDYKVYPPKYFDVLWASPPCTEYSRCKTTGVRDIEGANEIVQRTLDIIEYFEPKFWALENPQTGLLKDQWFMYGLPFKDLDYCKYGMPYRKRTRIWNNITRWEPRPLCKKDCLSMNEEKTRHKEEAQRNGSTAERRLTGTRFKQSELYRIPTELIREILLSI
jgi:site-specific DNA-cytosine methylase